MRWTTLRRAFVLACFSILTLASLGISCEVYAQTSAKVHFEIAAQPLDRSLKQFALQSKRQVIFDPASVPTKNAPAIKGDLTPEEALKALLDGSGLAFTLGKGDTLVITSVAVTSSSGEPKSSETENSGLTEIVVTATKRDTNLQNTAVAITAFSSVDLDAGHITNLSDLAMKTPGLFVGGDNGLGSSPITIRGIGSLNLGIGADEGVGVYVDGVYQATPFADLFTFIDVDQVEILRGPQGTLYGRNATGGAILINTLTPSAQPTFRADVTATNLGGFEGRGLASGPLVDGELYGKISAGIETRDGYSYNGLTGQRLNNEKNHLISGALRLTPGDTWDLTLRAYHGVRNSTQADKNLLDGLPLDDIPSNFPDYDNKTFQGVTLNASANILGATFTSVTGYTDAQTTTLTNSANVGLTQERTIAGSHGWYQELRLASATDQPFTWLAGVNGLHEKAYDRTDFALLFLPFGLNFYSDLVTDSYAGFLEASYKVTQSLTVTAGARYTHDKKDWLDCNAAGGYTNILTNWTPNLCNGMYVPDSNSWNAVTPHFVIDQRVAEGVFAYLSATKGFRSGGWNFTEKVTGPHSGVDPENVWSYEAGLKTETFDHRLRINLAAYLADYSNLQVRSLNPATDLLVLRNAATARIKGSELEVLAMPIKALQIGATASYMDARYRSYTYTLANVMYDYSGNYLSDSPKWQAGLSAQYGFAMPINATLTPRLEYSYVSEVFFDPTNQLPFGAKGHETLNGRLRYATAGSRWGVEAFVENATNQREPTYTYSGITPQIAAARIPPPRIYGAKVFFEF